MGMCVIPANMLIDNPEIKFCVSVFVCICFAPEKKSHLFYFHRERTVYHTQEKSYPPYDNTV